jgi:hypothetical protein
MAARDRARGDAILEFFVHADAAAAPPCKSEAMPTVGIAAGDAEFSARKIEKQKCFLGNGTVVVLLQFP